jgi:DNA adenine methylase Dam
MANPVTKCVGGKRQLLPQLAARLPESFSTYYEPFVGGGALFFYLQSQGRITRAVLSDANVRLMRTYAAVRDSVENVVGLVQKMPIDKESFYRIRAQSPNDGTDVDVAAWYIYINRACFNGLYRENRKGKCNVSYGTPKDPIIDPSALRASSAALQGVELRHGDFAQDAERIQPGDFVYLDPPYCARLWTYRAGTRSRLRVKPENARRSRARVECRHAAGARTLRGLRPRLGIRSTLYQLQGRAARTRRGSAHTLSHSAHARKLEHVKRSPEVPFAQ